MISMIIMLIVFLSFASIISYSVMTMNQNLIATGSIETTNNELRNIKQVLISEAKPILSSVDYALPYGTDDSVNDRHTLPAHLNLPLKNQKGYFYQYCPYGLVDGTSKPKNITQNDGSTYSVATTEINSVDYVTHSENAHSLSGAPEVLAFILSTQSDEELNCQDVLYSSNENTFYSNNAKVVAITKSEVEQYNRLNNLSGVTEALNVSNSEASDIFTMIANDTSNKSYEITLTGNVTLNNDFSILRDKNKSAKITIDLDGNLLMGQSQLNFENIDLEMRSGSTGLTHTFLPAYDFVDSNVKLDGVNIGGFTTNNSKVLIKDSYLESTESQTAFYSFNSDIIFRGNVDIDGSNKKTQDLISLLNSEFVLEKDSHLYLSYNGSGSALNLMSITDSKVSFYSDVTERSSSTGGKVKAMFISNNSDVFLNSSTITLLGKLANNNVFIRLRGNLSALYSEIKVVNGSKITNFIQSQGGSMKLNDSKIGQNSNSLGTTIIDDEGFKYISGNSSNTIYKGATGCFSGRAFENYDGTIPSTIATSSESTSANNTSTYICL